ncbi:GDSL esterase/lipase At5g03980-like [Vitis vinifera]|uniref:GDSL esterase/lipase At5g03980-like n=1 Tax=Vitis vinifera TaxID=29760 RepID=UPI0008FEC8D4|nr:GDSL esterase/lipase At5g03980-like [Vitis vinifera]|eukprot:XP_019080348.1 PREDICTED: GDSL esterase/lipase At5g03980-like [Vitis vinifera]
MTAGLPFLNLYMTKDADFSHGVNLVVAGSTAMSTSSLTDDHILSPVTNLRYNFNGFLSIVPRSLEVLSLWLGRLEAMTIIMHSFKKVIDYGAQRVVVPGNFPIGCFRIYLTGFQNNDSAAYDEHDCLKGLNDFAKYHNDHLQKQFSE